MEGLCDLPPEPTGDGYQPSQLARLGFSPVTSTNRVNQPWEVGFVIWTGLCIKAPHPVSNGPRHAFPSSVSHILPQTPWPEACCKYRKQSCTYPALTTLRLLLEAAIPELRSLGMSSFESTEVQYFRKMNLPLPPVIEKEDSPINLSEKNLLWWPKLKKIIFLF